MIEFGDEEDRELFMLNPLALVLKRQDEIEELRSSLEVAHEAMQEFVDRRNAGQIRSKYTYAKFKKILGLEAAPLVPSDLPEEERE